MPLGSLITSQGLLQELWASLTTAWQALGIATVLALLISYLTALPFFRPLAFAASKLRYLTLTGLTFFMALLLSSGHQVKLTVLVFGATVYLVTGMTQVILGTTQEELDHARTLGLGEWGSFWEVVVRGKLPGHARSRPPEFRHYLDLDNARGNALSIRRWHRSALI